VYVSLPPDLEGLVSDSLETGPYASPDDVIREALHLLRERDAAREASRDRVLEDIIVGVRAMERGEFQEYDSMDDLVAKIEADGRAILAANSGEEPR